MRKLWEFVRSPNFMAVVAVVGFAFALYQTFFYERRGNLVFTITPPAKVLDVKKAVGGLEISYAGEDLRESKRTLWVISATLRNDGNAEIKKGDFDENDPVGISVKEGQIVDTPSLRTSVDYLKRNLKLVQSEGSITISPSIIEAGDSVFISFLVLGDEVNRPEILPIGKVAGMRNLELRNADDGPSFSLWDSITYADKWWVQIFRSLFYFFVFIVAVALTVGVVSAILTPFEQMKGRKKSRQRQVEFDKYRLGQPMTQGVRALGRMFVSEEYSSLPNVYRVLNIFKDRLELKANLIPTLSVLESEKLALKCYPFDRWDQKVLLNITEYGFPISETTSEERVVEWIAEFREFAEHFNIDLTKADESRFNRYAYEYPYKIPSALENLEHV